MKAIVEIDAGVCGFKTTASASSEDCQNAVFEITTNCPKIEKYIAALRPKEPIDAYNEISHNSRSVILSTAVESSVRCCVSCVVPLGLFKAMQSACGLALPKDITIKLSKD